LQSIWKIQSRLMSWMGEGKGRGAEDLVNLLSLIKDLIQSNKDEQPDQRVKVQITKI
jgi:hypothetical protein